MWTIILDCTFGEVTYKQSLILSIFIAVWLSMAVFRVLRFNQEIGFGQGTLLFLLAAANLFSWLRTARLSPLWGTDRK